MNGEYSAESLAKVFIDNWIPYYECQKCGRWDYCKYAQPHPANPNRAVDIKCGVAVDSVRNFVQATFPILERLSGNKIQEYLNGLFYLCKFIYDAEQYIGMFMESRFLRSFGEHAPTYFARIIHLRDSLNSLAFSWKDIDEFRSKRSVLFVEGYAEKEFLDEMRKCHSTWFIDLNVEVYGGKGNRRLKRIQMLLDKYKELGYEIYAQGDADGKDTDIFKSLIKSGSVKKENTFVFKYDFETAIPLPLLYAALKDMEFLKDVQEEQFIETLIEVNTSIIEKLREKLSLDIEPHKLELANTISRILRYPCVLWWESKNFMNETELGRFLQFIQKMI